MISSVQELSLNRDKRGSNSKGKLVKFKKEINYHLMIWPGMIFLIIFAYFPMMGYIMAFNEYSLNGGIFHSPFVGFLQFKILFSDPAFWTAVQNTLGMSIVKFILSFFSPIIFALLLNELKIPWFKRLVQTASYLPYFISWVVVASLMIFWLGSDSSGIINIVLVKLHIIQQPIDFLTYPEYFWWIAGISEVWKNTGWWAIIYLATISGIDPALYEAAIVDGAGRWKRMLYVTLPSIKGAVFTVFILSFGYLIYGGLGGSNFNQAYLLGNPLNTDTSDVFDTYILRTGISLGRYSFATAAGLIQSLVCLVLVYSSNAIVKFKDRDQGVF